MELFIKDYLNHLGMDMKYIPKTIPCEICVNTKTTTIRETISIGKDSFGKLPVEACNRCGFLFQNPRFNEEFYEDYYAKYYRNVLKGSAEPSKEFIDDQISRGKILYETIKKYISKPGSMLDVGCSAGGTMVSFLENGWKVFGTDPDIGFVKYGKEKLGLPIEAVSAEKMNLGDKKFDFIMILGSLEHVYDPNLTLDICRKASSENGFLLLEGRGHPQKESKLYFNHNHHRYFTFNSLELIMIKHGWEPVLTTDKPICGPTRPGGIYCLGKASKTHDTKSFLKMIESGKRELPEDIIAKFDKLDGIKKE